MTKRTIVMLSYIAFNSAEGLNRRIRGIVKFIQSRGWNVTLYCPRYGKSEESEHAPEHAVTLQCWPRTPKNKLERALSHSIYMLRLLIKLLSSSLTMDVVQIEQQPLALLTPILRGIKSAPVIIDDFMFMSHYNSGFAWLLSYALDLIAIKTASAIATASEYSLDYLRKLGSHNIYAPNGIEIPKRIALPKPSPSSLFVGTLEFSQNVKAILHLMEIVQKLKTSGIVSDVIVVGGPDSKARLFRAEVKARGLDIRFTGRLSDDMLTNHLEQRGIGLLPFFLDTPTIGGQRVKALEYIAHGMVVISGPEGLRGVEGAVNGKNCIIVDNPEMYGRVFKDVIERWDEYRKMGIEARELAYEHSWEKSLVEWEEELNTVSRQKRGCN